jgi:hypothetical protein
MDENRVDGCLGVDNSFSRFVDNLLTVFTGEESGISSIHTRDVQLYSLGNDVMPLGPVGILTRLKSSLELRKDINQNFCRILLQTYFISFATLRMTYQTLNQHLRYLY